MTSGIRPGICAILITATVSAVDDAGEAAYRQGVLNSYGLGPSQITARPPAPEPVDNTHDELDEELSFLGRERPLSPAWRLSLLRLPTKGTNTVGGVSDEFKLDSSSRVQGGLVLDGGSDGWDLGLSATYTLSHSDALDVTGVGVLIEPMYAFGNRTDTLRFEVGLPLGLATESWAQGDWVDQAVATEIGLMGRLVYRRSAWQMFAQMGVQRSQREVSFLGEANQVNISGVATGLGIGRTFAGPSQGGRPWVSPEWRVTAERLPIGSSITIAGTGTKTLLDSAYRLQAGAVVAGGTPGWDLALSANATTAAKNDLSMRGVGLVIEPMRVYALGDSPMKFEIGLPIGVSKESWSWDEWSDSCTASEIGVMGRLGYRLAGWQLLAEAGYQRSQRKFDFFGYATNWTASGPVAGLGIGRTF